MTADIGAIQKVGVLGVGRDGRRHRGARRERRHPGRAARHRAGGRRRTAARWPSAPSRSSRRPSRRRSCRPRGRSSSPPAISRTISALLADCDWIVEAVIERVDIKQKVFRAVDGVRKAGSIVSSNTSTIPFAKLMEGLPEAFARDFLITHFFNPPRYMRLLELVAGPAHAPGGDGARPPLLRHPARQERRRLQGHARPSSPTASAPSGSRARSARRSTAG